MRYLSDLILRDKRILIRADLNVPLSDGTITNDNRLKQFLPTLRFILEQRGRPIVLSHLGRPNGRRDATWSLRPIATRLADLLGAEVIFAPGCVGPEVEKLVQEIPSGKVLLLENLRFEAGEQANDPEFAAHLARLGDVLVCDAFGTAHRLEASIVSLPKLFAERAAGLVLQREIEFYERNLEKPRGPVCLVLGGLNVGTKLSALANLAKKIDKMIIGGALANTLLAAQGVQMGRSSYEAEYFAKVFELLALFSRHDRKVYLPVDFMVGPSRGAQGLARAVPAQEMPADMIALDIGPATSLLYKEALHTAETIVWVGPMGVFENEDYAKGTTDMTEHIASAHGITVVGGNDTVAAVQKMELAHKFDFISTGGTSLLTMLDGKPLPGIAALE